MVVITIETSVRPGMQYDAGTTMSVTSVMNIAGKKLFFLVKMSFLTSKTLTT